MKLNVDLSDLWKKVSKMGAEQVTIDLQDVWHDGEVEFDDQLSSTGVEIKLDELASEQGLLSVRGRQVLLFIPDHGFKVQDVLDDPSKGNKFHVSDCRTLEDMKRKKRFERYKVTNNMSGLFDIYGTSDFNGSLEGTVELHICKNCINQLNYKGAANKTVSDRTNLVKSFDIEEFFTTYSSLFRRLPKQHIKDITKGYSRDWESISSATRKAVNYQCQHCKVDLSSAKRLLHVHHRNGEKSDNSRENLVALCADCHRKEPYHQHMFVKHSDTQQINKLRNEQGVLTTSNWTSIKQKADPSLTGVIDHCIKKGYSIPDVGFSIKDQVNNNEIVLELAWPEKKIGVSLHNFDSTSVWKIFSLDEAIRYFSKGNSPF